jgi:hypothetical protein
MKDVELLKGPMTEDRVQERLSQMFEETFGIKSDAMNEHQRRAVFLLRYIICDRHELSVHLTKVKERAFKLWLNNEELD